MSVHGSLKSLIQGVSQQPARDRLPGQGEVQENFLSDAVDGLVRRMGTSAVTHLIDTGAETSFYNAQFDGEEYFVGVGEGAINVWDLDGNPQPVKVTGDHTDYFTVQDRDDIRFAPVQVQDNDGTDQALYIGNRKTVCQLRETVPVLRTQDTVIQFLGGQYGREYKIIIQDDVGNVWGQFLYQTPDGSNPEHVHFVSGTAIAAIFERLMRQGPGNASGEVPNYRAHPYQIQGANIGDRDEEGAYEWNYCAEAIRFNATFDYTRNVDLFSAFTRRFKISRVDDTILLTPREFLAVGGSGGVAVEGTQPNYIWDYDVIADDGEANSTIALVRKDIGDPSRLPRFGSENMVVKVAGADATADDYWLKFQVSRPSGYFPRGVYQSTTGDDVAPGTSGADSYFWEDGFDVIYGGDGIDTVTLSNIFDIAARDGRESDAIWHYDPGQPDFVYVARYGGNIQIRGACMIHRTVETIRNSTGDQVLTWDEAVALGKANGFPPNADELGGFFRDEFVPLLTLRENFNGFGRPGVWVESTSPFEPNEIDTSTMPRILVREDGEFKLDFADWKPRRAGDNNTNPVPAFIGSTIEDMTQFQSRLVILTPDQVSMSRTGRYDDFWFQSGAASAADDPIGVGSTARKKSRFRYLVPHNLDLVIFADNAQFVVLGETALTFENTQIIAATNYLADTSAAPVPAGDVVFYPIQFGKFTGIKEYRRLEEDRANASVPVTAHVPRYVQGSPKQLLSVSNLNMMLVTAEAEPNTVYVYQYLMEGDSRVQAAWHKWVFPAMAEIEHMFLVDSTLHMVYRYNGAIYKSVMDLERRDNPIGYQLGLDSVLGGNLAAIDSTIGGIDTAYFDTTTLPAPASGQAVRDIVCLVLDSGEYRGMEIPVVGYTVVDGSGAGYPTVRWHVRRSYKSLGTLTIGARFTSKYGPTLPRIKDANGVVIDNAPLILRSMAARLEDTGYLKATVSEKYKPDYTTEFSGRVLGDPDNQIGTVGIVDADFEFRVGSDSRRASVILETDDPRPVRILSVEWRGQARGRGRRINVE